MWEEGAATDRYGVPTSETYRKQLQVHIKRTGFCVFVYLYMPVCCDGGAIHLLFNKLQSQLIVLYKKNRIHRALM